MMWRMDDVEILNWDLPDEPTNIIEHLEEIQAWLESDEFLEYYFGEPHYPQVVWLWHPRLGDPPDFWLSMRES